MNAFERLKRFRTIKLRTLRRSILNLLRDITELEEAIERLENVIDEYGLSTLEAVLKKEESHEIHS